MPLSRSRDYLSIGEVLEAIRPDFPDVSISKIRFLENEGLIAPERTESGYRKFYDADVRRLRYILELQRDHFLPLKVIRRRLAEVDGDDAPPVGEEPEASGGEPGEPAAAGSDGPLSRAELCRATGLSDDQLGELEDFGVLARRREDSFDDVDLEVGRAAAALIEFGIEPRHMRMLRHSAQREAALATQIVAPVARRSDPRARADAADTARRILIGSRRLRDALVRAQLRDLL
jgi:DNA-binding transcriptional MerR regulator